MAKLLALLQTRIEQVHKCDVVHSESVFVHETLGGDTIWQGYVEVFDLYGHAEAKKCYAWPCDPESEIMEFVTILEKSPVDSPAMAVRAAIFFDAQPVQHHRHALSS